MKHTTGHRRKKITSSTATLIRRTHGLAAEIAVVADFYPSYVSEVVAGKKAPSQRFTDAVSIALLNITRRLEMQVVEMDYPTGKETDKEMAGATR
jgi:hypothetical protein